MSDTIDTTEQIIEDDPIAVRRAKREALMAAGKDPYGHAFAYSHHLADLAEQYADLEDGASTEDEMCIRDRMRLRKFGRYRIQAVWREEQREHPVGWFCLLYTSRCV